MERLRQAALAIIVGLLLLIGSLPASAYSLLTHEQLIDLTWDDSIVPLLLSRYPHLTPAQLDEARAFAYGGCVIQDIGYYPFGQQSFSDLTHYVRSGDFVLNLFRNAGNADELAFAVGALSHYIGDTYGHSIAVNVAVPIEFPRLRRKYGRVVSYAEGEHQHIQTEFAFDVDEVAHDRMAPLHYLRHIGLGVSMRQLGLAYYQTYGLSQKFTGSRKERVNERSYRFAVRSFIPRIADALALLHRHKEPKDVDTPEAVELRAEIAAMSTENKWKVYRHRPGIGTWALAGVLFILPKVGPLKLVALKDPTEQTESDYVHSVVVSVYELRLTLRRFTPPPARLSTAGHSASTSSTAGNGPKGMPRDPVDPRHPLMNRDLDTGKVVRPGGYRLTDRTYALLLHQLTAQPTVPVPPGIKEDIEKYYSNLDVPFTTKKHPQQWEQVLKDLATLKGMPTSKLAEPFPTYEDDIPESTGTHSDD